jgi:hypothetical protein
MARTLTLLSSVGIPLLLQCGCAVREAHSAPEVLRAADSFTESFSKECEAAGFQLFYEGAMGAARRGGRGGLSQANLSGTWVVATGPRDGPALAQVLWQITLARTPSKSKLSVQQGSVTLYLELVDRQSSTPHKSSLELPEERLKAMLSLASVNATSRRSE